MFENLTPAEYQVLLRQDFVSFAARCFQELNPQAELAMNWHLEVIAAKLTAGEDTRMPTHARVRAFLENVAKRQIPITYQELTKALQILPPHSVHQLTEALERLMEEDAAADRPFIAALAVSKVRGGLPAPGFFDCARRLGRFAGDPDSQDAWSFHAAELNAVLARWGGSRDH
jgi:hypothetical protein